MVRINKHLQTVFKRIDKQSFVYTALVVMSFVFVSCGFPPFPGAEARDDERQYRRALEKQQEIQNQLVADRETEVVSMAGPQDDAADDPAIWYNLDEPERSVIFGSNKVAGIHAYDLNGAQLQFITCGKINNIDIRKNVLLGDRQVDILAGSNRSNNTIDVFVIDKNGRISSKPDYQVGMGAFIPYGFCLYKTGEGQLFAFVNDKNGEIIQLSLALDEQNHFQSQPVRSIKLPTQLEGMVVDDTNNNLYVGEEEGAIHKFSAKPDGSVRGSLLEGSTKSNKQIRYDIEGLALLPPHFLIASSQGNFSYAVFDLEKNAYLTSFVIKEGHIDGAEETDGLEIGPGFLGSDFPEGILVVQDGFNRDGSTPKPQNFKFVDLRKIISFLR